MLFHCSIDIILQYYCVIVLRNRQPFSSPSARLSLGEMALNQALKEFSKVTTLVSTSCCAFLADRSTASRCLRTKLSTMPNYWYWTGDHLKTSCAHLLSRLFFWGVLYRWLCTQEYFRGGKMFHLTLHGNAKWNQGQIAITILANIHCVTEPLSRR